MKIKNTTEWPDYFLRRLTSWCCKQTGCKVRDIKIAEFRNRSYGACSGRAHLRIGRVFIAIGPADNFPVKPSRYPGRTSDAFLSPPMKDRLDALVAVTAHEVTHIREWNTHCRRGERRTRLEERKAVAAFNEQRDKLIGQWMSPPPERKTKPTLTRQEKNEQRSRELLKNWERKLKMAENKVKKYRQKCRYYDRVAATRKEPADSEARNE